MAGIGAFIAGPKYVIILRYNMRSQIYTNLAYANGSWALKRWT